MRVKVDLAFTITRYNSNERKARVGLALFGYIVPNQSALNDAQNARFRAVYCGLCRVLRRRHGWVGASTLSYDLTFLGILLAALYEPEEERGEERCPTHPLKRHAYAVCKPLEYVADMNVALAYYKCLDNWTDEHSAVSLGEAKLLKRGYRRVSERHPDKCAAIESWLREIHEIESRPEGDIDAPVNSTGRMLGELFCYEDGYWSESLRIMGDGLGRFIYFMDAYDDLPGDVRHNRFNPLKPFRERPDFEAMCKDALTMMVADCTQEFERMPIVQDADLLRNVLYSGVWSRYVQIQKKRETDSKGEK